MSEESSPLENRAVDLRAQAHRLAEYHRQPDPPARSRDAAELNSASPLPGRDGLLSARLSTYSSILNEAVQKLQSRTAHGGRLSLAAEWLLDNYYIAVQALRSVEKDFPPHFERQLPRLHDGRLRVYSLAHEIIQMENILLDMERVQGFIEAYQEALPLSMGELWAFPIMLRLGILEYLVEAVVRVTELEGVLLSQLVPGPDSAAQLNDEITVENSLRSLRSMAVFDWKRFFETVSLVEAVLRQDPARLYSGMDFETRDQYRKVVEEIAASGPEDELLVARTAVHLAGARLDELDLPSTPARFSSSARKPPPDQRPGWDGFRSLPDTHTGYFLLGRGRKELEQAVGYSPQARQRLERLIRAYPTPFYLVPVTGFTLAFILLALLFAALAQAPAAGLLLIFLLALVPALTIAVDLINWVFTQFLKPQNLPRMDFRSGLPPECAALVVIPALLSGPDEVDALLDQLELHYLRNTDAHLFFALLTDFTDAPAKNQPDDDTLVDRARQGIHTLNEKYPRSATSPFPEGRFALLQRERRWNPSEGIWMGWERKRGKLNELNHVILAAQGASMDERFLGIETSFPRHAGDLSFLQYIRYVITLDADTILPRDAARELIAVMAHPLNRARL